MTRRNINPASLPDTGEHSHNQAVVVNGILHMSGQVGMEADRSLASDEITGQTRQAFENIGAICREMDRELADVVKVTAYVVGIDGNFDGYYEAYEEAFSEPYPAHTVLGVEQLAGPEYLVEIEAEIPGEE